MDTRSAHVPPPARVDHAVAYGLATTPDTDNVYPTLLGTIGTWLGWHLGAAWEIVAPPGEELGCVEVWQAPGVDANQFEHLTRRTRFARGMGLPGRVWETGDPCWVVDVTVEPTFLRARGAADAGLHAAYCFPICGSTRVLGAVEFFTTQALDADEELLATMGSLGRQIGQFVERRQAQEAVSGGAELRRAMLDAALDCVVTMDEQGRVLDFNPAAERTFGYRADEAIGTEMAELLVPPSLRRQHRAGLERYLQGGEPVVLGRRIEVTGMRRDGSELPVELTIVRIDMPGPARFTGYLRDITEKKRAEKELRASRARIVEAGDNERRRLERDLHDGAQQLLDSVGLALRLCRTKIGDDPAAAGAMLDQAIAHLHEARSALRELARGIHPAVLTEGGLVPALRSLLARGFVTARLVSVPAGRYPAPVEAAVYFVVAEALTNAARYAEASIVEVDVAQRGDSIEVEIRDDGRGGADAERGSGLHGIADRVAALGGTFEVLSPVGAGTALRVAIPCPTLASSQSKDSVTPSP